MLREVPAGYGIVFCGLVVIRVGKYTVGLELEARTRSYVSELQQSLDALSELDNPAIGGGLSGHLGTCAGLGQQDGII